VSRRPKHVAWPEWEKTHTLKAGSAVKMNAGGLLHNSEALACPQCGGVGGHHYEGHGSVPRCSTLGPMPEKA